MEDRRENKSGQLDFYHLHWSRDEIFFQEGEKILSIRKCEEPTFIYTEQPAYVMMAINVIKTKRWDNKLLVAIFNSKLIKFWFEHNGKMQGSHFQVDKEPLLNIPIKTPDKKLEMEVINLVNHIIAEFKKNNKANIKFFEAEIDQLVYKLYGLTREEIAIVEGKV